MYRVAKDMIDLVGYTPLVKINHIVPNKKVKVYAKLERYNPAGSVKDRIAKYMIEYGEKEGLLTKDKIVIEPTSGNTGIALAMVCAVKGYRLELVMPETMSMERRKILTAYGVKIVLSKGAKRNGWGHRFGYGDGSGFKVLHALSIQEQVQCPCPL